MIYMLLITNDATTLAACETEARAVRREGEDYFRITPARFRYYWNERDMARYTVMGIEGWLERQNRPAPKELALMIGM